MRVGAVRRMLASGCGALALVPPAVGLVPPAPPGAPPTAPTPEVSVAPLPCLDCEVPCLDCEPLYVAEARGVEPVAAEGEQVTVPGTGTESLPYAAVGPAAQAADSGQELRIEPGRYGETASLARPMRLRGIPAEHPSYAALEEAAAQGLRDPIADDVSIDRLEVRANGVRVQSLRARTISGPEVSVELGALTVLTVGQPHTLEWRVRNSTFDVPEGLLPAFRLSAVGPLASSALVVEVRAEGGSYQRVTPAQDGASGLVVRLPALRAPEGDGYAAVPRGSTSVVALRLTALEAFAAELAVTADGDQTGARYAAGTGRLRAVVPVSEAGSEEETAIGGVQRGPASVLARLSGADRSATAAAVSAATFPAGAGTVHVATGAGYADALAGGPAAALAGGPVLLVERDRVPPATRQELGRLAPSQIVVLGGTGAVSAAVEHELSERAATRRVAGADRFATAAAVSATVFAEGVAAVYVATGNGFADALSGGAAAAHESSPVLLTRHDDLPAATATELRRLRPGRIVVLGGPSAVSERLLDELAGYTSGAVTRSAGTNRYATSAAVVAAAFPGPVDTVHVATGTDFPDALAGVPAAARGRGPLLLVRPDAVPAEVASELERLRPARIVVLGGERSVSRAVERELARYVR